MTTFDETEENAFHETPKIPFAGLRVYMRNGEFEIPANAIKANDSFRFDPLTRTLTLELFAEGVEVIPRGRRQT